MESQYFPETAEQKRARIELAIAEAEKSLRENTTWEPEQRATIQRAIDTNRQALQLLESTK